MSDRTVQGRRAKADGAFLEHLIERSAWYYEQKGIAAIDKTPEPFRILRPYDRNKGQFIGCFEKQAQPDFKGALMDATMVLFDAKHTNRDRITRDAVTKEQEECFERYGKMEALCFLVVSIGFKDFYRVPWVVFRDMKKIFGHKYMAERELEQYRIRYDNGRIYFLDGIELKKGEEDEDTETETDKGAQPG